MGDRVAVRFVADVHVGNHKRFGGTTQAGVNDRCRRILGVLADAAAGTDTLVVLGDLFDVANPTPQVVAATLRALTHGERAFLLLGNHDMVSTVPGDNALAVFSALRGVINDDRFDIEVADQPVATNDLYLVPFRPQPFSEWFAEAVSELARDWPSAAPILCFHAGVRDHNTPKYLWGSPDAIDVDLLFDVMRSCGSKLAVCGNWHNHRVWQRDGMTVVQVGALVPTGFDNPGPDYGHVVDIMNDGEVVIGRQLPGPRFLTLTEVPDDPWQPPEGADGCYLRVIAEDPRGSIRDDFLMAELAVDVEVVAPSTDTAAQEAEAAEAARTGETLESSLRDYVQAMPLDEGIDRAAVEARVLNYLARGA